MSGISAMRPTRFDPCGSRKVRIVMPSGPKTSARSIGRDFLRLPHRRGESRVRDSPDAAPYALALKEKRSKHGSGSLVAERQTTDHEVEGDAEPTLPVQASRSRPRVAGRPSWTV